MATRNLKVIKWLATTPAVAICTACSREFQVPVKLLSRVMDAQRSLRTQFNEHNCESGHE
jgi:hypothetical protein